MEGETTQGRNDSGRNDSGRTGKWAKRPVTIKIVLKKHEDKENGTTQNETPRSQTKLEQHQNRRLRTVGSETTGVK